MNAYVSDVATTPNIAVEDPVSVHILRRYQPAILVNYTPLQIFHDGNCCYQMAATGIYSNEGLHHYIQLCTAIEMLQYRPH